MRSLFLLIFCSFFNIIEPVSVKLPNANILNQRFRSLNTSFLTDFVEKSCLAENLTSKDYDADDIDEITDEIDKIIDISIDTYCKSYKQNSKSSRIMISAYKPLLRGLIMQTEDK